MFYKDKDTMARSDDYTQEDMSEDGLVPRDTRVFSCEYCGKDFGKDFYLSPFQKMYLKRAIRSLTRLQKQVMLLQNPWTRI